MMLRDIFLECLEWMGERKRRRNRVYQATALRKPARYPQWYPKQNIPRWPNNSYHMQMHKDYAYTYQQHRVHLDKIAPPKPRTIQLWHYEGNPPEWKMLHDGGEWMQVEDVWRSILKYSICAPGWMVTTRER